MSVSESTDLSGSEENVHSDPQRKIKDQIFQTKQELKQCKAKILKLLAANKTDNAVPEGDVESSYDALTSEMSQNILHKQILQLCLFSNAITDRIISRDCSEETLKKVLKDLNVICKRNSELLTLAEEHDNIFQQKIEASSKYDKSLQEYQDVLEDQKTRNTDDLQSTNPELAKMIQVIKLKIKKINIMKRTITNMIAGSTWLFKDHKNLRKFLENHTDNVRMDDFEQCEKEP